jgi:hypothetical protein
MATTNKFCPLCHFQYENKKFTHDHDDVFINNICANCGLTLSRFPVMDEEDENQMENEETILINGWPFFFNLINFIFIWDYPINLKK